MDTVVITLIVLATLCLAGYLVYLGYEATQIKEEVEETKSKLLLTESEVKKLTKAKLVELAASLDITIDPKSTKAVIVEEIEKHR